MRGIWTLVRERVEKGDYMLSAGVVGREGGYMSQKLDLVSCCLGVAARRFDNLQSRVALIAGARTI